MSSMQRRPAPRGSGVAAEAAFVLLALLFAGGMFGVGIIVGRATKDTHGGETAAAATSASTSTASTESTSDSTTAETSTEQTTTQATTTQATTTSGGGGSAALAAGKQLFSQNCSSCHTLEDAGAQGNDGPNLDDLKPSLDVAKRQVTNGGGGMPAFKGTLTPTQINVVSAYVAAVAGK
jgi:mono/diheme cytochrome c family protein